ncbi:MAG: hypothetical protein HY719_09610 [Planctomycetes bacterium]|nr:hypothetical protein [Planctomycetota bacterium]
MHQILAGVALVVVGGVFALVADRWSGRAAGVSAALGLVLGGAFGAAEAIQVLLGVTPTPAAIRPEWAFPLEAASAAMGVDALSAFFLLPVFIVPALAAISGVVVMEEFAGHKAVGVFWFFFCLLAASLAVVMVARNGVLFLVAWEVMSVAAWFLITFHHESDRARDAGVIHLIAAHIGVAFLLGFFLLLAPGAGGLDFDTIAAARRATATATATASDQPTGGAMVVAPGVLFILALVGFGTKAGLAPGHVWLPEAHSAAPAFASAVLSGAMIKAGVYGLARALALIGCWEFWWGPTLVVVGIATAAYGALLALAQRDLKRVVAYSTVENAGIMVAGFGVGALGMSSGSAPLALLGFGGGMLHALNHAAFKPLLFLVTGSVHHAAGTYGMDRLGGLMKRMPWTGLGAVIGAVAACGLPPLNGFVSEFLIGLAAFRAEAAQPVEVAAPLVVVVGGLALVAGLVGAAFTRSVGVAFLGHPRAPEAERAREAGWPVTAPLVLLAGCCLFLGMAPVAVLPLLSRAAAVVAGMDGQIAGDVLRVAAGPLFEMQPAVLGFVGLVILFGWWRARLLARREVRTAVTWDCGYAAPAATMQYTSTSFTQQIVDLFGVVVRWRRRMTRPAGLFPTSAAVETLAPDPVTNELFAPAFRGAARLFRRLHGLHSGHVQVYVLYIAFTMLLVVAWKMG